MITVCPHCGSTIGYDEEEIQTGGNYILDDMILYIVCPECEGEIIVGEVGHLFP